MKLSALNSAIRKHEGAVKIWWWAPFGKRLTCDLQKTPLLAELKSQFGGDRNVETGLRIDENGFFCVEPEHEGTRFSAGDPDARPNVRDAEVDPFSDDDEDTDPFADDPEPDEVEDVTDPDDPFA